MQVATSISPALGPPLPSKGWMRLSPINRRRLENFRANRRGHVSLWLFSVLFVLVVWAELIGNGRPLMVLYKGQWVLPGVGDLPGLLYTF